LRVIVLNSSYQVLKNKRRVLFYFSQVLKNKFRVLFYFS